MLDQRFWGKVDIRSPSECWLWRGSTNPTTRYGKLSRRVNGQLITHQAHRYAWMQVNGFIESYICVLHRCDVRLCVNPSHLFIGSRLDNARDRDEKGRQSQGENHARCLKGRFSVDDIREIRDSSLSHRELAKLYDCNRGAISLIQNRKMYMWVK